MPSDTSSYSPIILGVGAILAVVALVVVIILSNFLKIWVRAMIAKAPVGLFTMVAMRLRRVPVGLIVDSRITAVKAGIEIPTDPLEAHYLAGGSVGQVILAFIAADKAGIELDFNRACAIDLATKGPARRCSKPCAPASIPKSSMPNLQWAASPSTALRRTASA